MDLARVFENNKYMWDGQVYNSKEESNKVAKEYAAEEFEVRQIVEEEKHYIFTRREVEEVTTEGNPV